MSTPTSVQIIPGNLVLSGNVDTNDTDNTFCIDRANGRVGIGQGLTSLVTDSTDSNVLQISGEVKATRFHGDGTGITGLTDSKWLEDNDDVNNIYYSAGNVGIGGTPSSTNKLKVTGDILATGNVTAYSDRRLKSDIVKLKDALNKIDKLNGYTYVMNDKPSTGLIAQEVLEVLPEVVHGSEETTYSLAYGNMTGIIIEAIKELREKVLELENKIQN